MGYRRRRTTLVTLLCCVVAAFLVYASIKTAPTPADNASTIAPGQVAHEPLATDINPTGRATDALKELPIKGRAPKTGYSRKQFGDGWSDTGGCNVRERVLARDMINVQTVSDTDCRVRTGTLNDPYTGRQILFARGPATSSIVQIDHVVALSNAWQTGAQQLSPAQREQLSNDPLELLAVDGPANQDKGDADAATWLPSNKDYRCRYVARQVAIKKKYTLWVTQAEHDAIAGVLSSCPDQLLPIEQ